MNITPLFALLVLTAGIASAAEISRSGTCSSDAAQNLAEKYGQVWQFLTTTPQK